MEIYPPLPPIMVHSLALAPVTAIVSAFAMPLIGLMVKNRRIWDAFALTISTIVFIFTGIGYATVKYLGKPFIYLLGGWPPPVGIVYEVDEFAALLGLVSAFIIWLVVIYGVEYFDLSEDGMEWYYTMLLGLEAGVLGCIYTGDVFNVFVLFEVLSITSYGLVAFWNRKGECIEAAIKYSLIGALATTIYFLAVTFIYASLGTLNMADIAAKIRGLFFPVTGEPYGSIALGVGLFLALSIWAFTVEAGVAPNHFRVLDAYQVSPSTVAALLSAVAANVGFYLLARYLITLLSGAKAVETIVNAGLLIVLIMGLASIIVGSFLMIVQSDVNRILAYSSVLNYGYVCLAIGLATPLGIIAALFHMINHAIAKTLIFLTAGVYVKASGTRRLDGMEGVGRYAPITSALMIIAALALAGIPPFNGFVSKLILYEALLEVNLAPLVIIIVLSSALSLLGYLKIIYHAYTKPPMKDYGKVEPPKAMLWPMIILAALCIILGVASPWIYDMFIEPAAHTIFETDKFIEVAYEFAKKLLTGVKI